MSLVNPGSKGIFLVLFGALVSLVGAAGCSSAEPPPPKDPGPIVAETAKPVAPAEIPSDPVDLGSDCAKAEARCGGGVCELSMENGCDKPLTCEFAMLTVCQAQTDLVQAKAKRRDTFAAKTKDKVSFAADCAQGQVVSTKVEKASCK